jgi:hypothetical protein
MSERELKTLDDIKDISIVIVGELVEEGIIKDCTDTDDQTECEAQDIIREILCKLLKIEND